MSRLLLVLLLGFATALHAGQRSQDPIGEREDMGSLPSVERQQLEDWLQALAASWNTPRLSDYLDPDLPDRQRLLGAIEDQVPPDAELRVLSVGPVRVLDEDRAPGMITRVVRVSVRLQVQGSADNGGLERRESRQNLVVRWTRRVPE
ncbi:hypothetical protein [Aquisalimonas asiatica]|uniref:Uncharacterized protein n=1 Tax=Aquisalimonas asiatica TaxID=406100 RepID=A0A1H8TG39_9GAMM|nr:hypothetical protein [Aquisalimonas asiatica]SEO89584.1 hypothetical protein SAMN04488052_104130 [Aquisalimonas asiatica]